MRNQVAPCGTQSGYQRHLKYKQVTCQSCRDANYETYMTQIAKQRTPLALARKAFLAQKAIDAEAR